MSMLFNPFYMLHYHKAIKPHFTEDEKRALAMKISELTLEKPIWLMKDDFSGMFPELVPYINVKLSGMYLCSIYKAVFDDLYGRDFFEKQESKGE